MHLEAPLSSEEDAASSTIVENDIGRSHVVCLLVVALSTTIVLVSRSKCSFNLNIEDIANFVFHVCNIIFDAVLTDMFVVIKTLDF